MPSFNIARTWSALIIAAWVCAPGCADSSSRDGGLSATATAASAAEPPSALDLDGHPRSLSNQGQQGIIVVVFTRSDCPISNRYAPAVRELYASFHPRGVGFYLVYVDPGEHPDAIREHLLEYEYPCEGLRDPKHALVAYTGATVTPEAVVFGADGKIAYRGRIDDRNAEFGKAKASPTRNDLADAIEATLAGRPVAEPVTEAVGCYIGDLQ